MIYFPVFTALTIFDKSKFYSWMGQLTIIALCGLCLYGIFAEKAHTFKVFWNNYDFREKGGEE
jgi:hypothetical protein